jgi:hypothetical protein
MANLRRFIGGVFSPITFSVFEVADATWKRVNPVRSRRRSLSASMGVAAMRRFPGRRAGCESTW